MLFKILIPYPRCPLLLERAFQRYYSTNTIDMDDGVSIIDFISHVSPRASENGHSAEALKANVVGEPIPHTAPLRKIALETYGCQMNVSDTDLVRSILLNSGFEVVKNDSLTDIDAILLMTCSIRENAESKIFERINALRSMYSRASGPSKRDNRSLLIGILGCMAERLKESLTIGKVAADLVCGPDAYRSLPDLLKSIWNTGGPAINVQLSLEETYAELRPVRSNPEEKSAFVSIMRGCDNMCSYCIVPFTRGRERSRPLLSIVDEIKDLVEVEGIKSITLLGQNVNSYLDPTSPATITKDETSHLALGFKTIYKPKLVGVPAARFTDLLGVISERFPDTWFRFTSPHPKDFPLLLLQLMKERKNICKHIHLPVQSGSTSVLERMRRGYTREAYLDLLFRIKEILPSATISTDIIVGFCGETEHEFQETLSLLDIAKYDTGYLFAYSQRDKTHAARAMADDISDQVKKERLRLVLDRFYSIAESLVAEKWIGMQDCILLERPSKRNPNEWVGRNQGNKQVVVKEYIESHQPLSPGQLINVEIIGGTSSTLFGRYLSRCPSFI